MSTFVPISRDEMEDFLSETTRRISSKSFERKVGTAGVYYIPLSPLVYLRISTSIGSEDEVVGVGKGAIHLALESRRTGKVLLSRPKTIKKYLGQTRVNRTMGWKKSLTKTMVSTIKAYVDNQDFFDAIAEGKDPSQKKESSDAFLLPLIEKVPGWERNNLLSSVHSQISNGRKLSNNQIAALNSILEDGPRQSKFPIEDLESLLQRAKDFSAPSRTIEILSDLLGKVEKGITLSTKQEDLISKISDSLENLSDESRERDLQDLRNLWVRAKSVGDSRALSFLTSVGTSVKGGKPLTENQRRVVEDIRTRLLSSKVAFSWVRNLDFSS